ncbi:MAG: LPS-assembly protein LptD [Candidatus Omnitrophica bacterium]|nr:LPS-assembly protein LptD [Candidatus Omnitrophota bacterium]
MFKKILLSYIIFPLLLVAAASAEGEDIDTKTLPIVVNGDKVQYDHANKIVTGTGNVSINYKDIRITCDKITVNLDAKEGLAEGNVTLYQQDNVFSAENVVYNFENKTGELINGEMKMPPWYGNAESIEKVADQEFDLNKSYITTCDYEKPHYRIEARTIKIYLGDRVTAWNVLFYVGDMPIMYIPYYNHPLKDNLPQVNLVPGHNDEWGAYLLSSWRYYFHPDSKGHVHVDWRSKRGFAEGLDYKYGMEKFGKGYARFYYLHDKEPGSGIDDKRYRVQVRHKWPVDENTFMAGEFHKLSDRDFIKDFFYKEEYELDHEPQTYLTLIGAKENYTLSMLYRPKVNDFFTVTERLPEARLNIRKLKLLNHLNLYYTNTSSIAVLNKSFANDVDGARAGDSYDATRADTYNELSYPFSLFGFLNLNPFIGTRQTFYTEDEAGNDNIVRDLYNTGVDIYARSYKIYDVETNFLNLDINKIRHLIIPSARYEYIREPKVSPEDLLQFDEIDAIRQKNSVELAIEHKLQTKRHADDGSEKTVDLLSFIVSSEYVFLDDFGQDNKLLGIKYDLETRPYDWLYFDAEAHLDREARQFDTFNADLHVTKYKDMTFGAGYRYEQDENSQVTSYFNYDIPNKDWKKRWGFRIYNRYELQEKQFQEQEYTIVKDLHCWSSELTCRIEDETDYTFWVIFRLKAFPDIPFFFRTTYRGPEPGARR